MKAAAPLIGSQRKIEVTIVVFHIINLSNKSYNIGVGGGHEDIDDMSHIEKQKVYADQKMTDMCRRIAETTSSQVSKDHTCS